MVERKILENTTSRELTSLIIVYMMIESKHADLIEIQQGGLLIA